MLRPDRRLSTRTLEECTMLRRRFTVAAVTLALVAAVQWMPTACAAQEEYIELLRSDLKADKTAIMTAAMQFTPQQAEIFWPIYREYDLELSKLGDALIALVKDYAANFQQMTPASAKDLTGRLFKIEKGRIELRQKYYGKFEKAMDPVVAARFVQVERQIGLLIDTQIAAEIPLIEKPAQ